MNVKDTPVLLQFATQRPDWGCAEVLAWRLDRQASRAVGGTLNAVAAGLKSVGNHELKLAGESSGLMIPGDCQKWAFMELYGMASVFHGVTVRRRQLALAKYAINNFSLMGRIVT
jgi:hypothetical protein